LEDVSSILLLLHVPPKAERAKEEKSFLGDTPADPGKGPRPLQPRLWTGPKNLYLWGPGCRALDTTIERLSENASENAFIWRENAFLG